MIENGKSLLFLPFLQIPSGHHQAANALMEEISQKYPQFKCEKVDILAYSYGKIESLVSAIYLKWIHALPAVYNSIYKMSVYKNIDKEKRYRLYEWLFLFFMKRLVREKQPDLIVCTHSLPAYMLNYLKGKKEINIPVINVYTDYFIHQFWGLENIDLHFVPSYRMKEYLVDKGINPNQIYISGIPIHPKLRNDPKVPADKSCELLSVLISGGNMGVGAIEELIKKISELKGPIRIQYFVLCGKNQKLFDRIKALKNNDLIPFPYIDCRERMNRLYDRIDAILTKPGGVTISECLYKRKPIFIYDALPGQEEINLKQLKELGVIFTVNKNKIHEQLVSILNDKLEMKQYYNRLEEYHSSLDTNVLSHLFAKLLFKKRLC